MSIMTNDGSLVSALSSLPNSKILDFLLERAHEFECDNNYWNVLGTCWKAAGSHDERERWITLFDSKRRNKHKIMKSRERRTWRNLPKRFEVYRAAHSDDEMETGLSWSLDKKFVERYAKGENRIVLTKVISKDDAWAYFDRRKESEVIIMPK